MEYASTDGSVQGLMKSMNFATPRESNASAQSFYHTVTEEEMRSMSMEQIKILAIAEEIMKIADGVNSDGLIARVEFDAMLEGTRYDHFKSWLFAGHSPKFDEKDKDHSGSISLAELKVLVAEYLDDLKELHLQLDKPMAVLCPRIVEEVKKISNDDESPSAWFKLFKELDENNSGTISREEFSIMIREKFAISEEDISNQEIATIWGVVDSSHDGTVKLSEFVDFLSNRWAARLDVSLRFEDVKNQVVTKSNFHIPTDEELEKCQNDSKSGAWSGLRMSVWARRHDKTMRKRQQGAT